MKFDSPLTTVVQDYEKQNVLSFADKCYWSRSSKLNQHQIFSANDELSLQQQKGKGNRTGYGFKIVNIMKEGRKYES